MMGEVKREKGILGGDKGKTIVQESRPEEPAGCLGIIAKALLQESGVDCDQSASPPPPPTPTLQPQPSLDPCDFRLSRITSRSSSSSHSLHSSGQRASRQFTMLRLSSSASARVIGFSSRSTPSRHQRHSLKLQQTQYQQQVSNFIDFLGKRQQ